MLRRLSCFLSAFAVLFFHAIPVFATGMEMGGAGVGIPVVGNINLDVVDFADYVWSGLRWSNNTVAHFIDKDICPNAPQLYGGHNFIPRRTLKDGQVGLYYVCEYCGKAYGEALEEAYQEYVDTLPYQQINNQGAFIWGMTIDDVVGKRLRVLVDAESDYTLGYLSPDTLILRERDRSAALFGREVRLSGRLLLMGLDTYVVLPVSGYYTLRSGASLWCAAGVQRSLSDFVSVDSWGVSCYSAVSAVWRFPDVLVVPDEPSSVNYSADTRVSGSVSNTGLYGYVDNGTLYQSTVGTIYNETTNVYQNPVTGETSGVSSWNYDYSDRSYTLTTNEGDEITVTYGDSAVTINEGGTTYNVYYLMEETEDVRQALESYCDHDYASTVTTAPTCTASGVRTFACSKCGDSYTQAIPPTGHSYQSAVTMAPTCVNTGVRTFACSECGDSYTVSIAATGHVWEVVRTVPTTFDNDTGQLVQQGYTLYECSVCHEQYRIDADSGGSSLPAPSSGGTSTGTDLSAEIDSGVGRGFLATIARGLTEDLPEVLKAASEWFTEFPQFYGSFMTFVKDGIAGCLPDVPRMMMGFGFGMATFIGIVRKIIGR